MTEKPQNPDHLPLDPQSIKTLSKKLFELGRSINPAGFDENNSLPSLTLFNLPTEYQTTARLLLKLYLNSSSIWRMAMSVKSEIYY